MRFGVEDAHTLALQSAFEGGQRFGIVVDEQGRGSFHHKRSLRFASSSSSTTPGFLEGALRSRAEPFELLCEEPGERTPPRQTRGANKLPPGCAEPAPPLGSSPPTSTTRPASAGL